ncbi:MAG TPA: hypothetical protein VNL71_23635, partial [Chloroflexota bacterium]|nr:hypothetical protein [Chloroflexota bacterium]
MARRTRRPFERDPNLTVTTPYASGKTVETPMTDSLPWRLDDALWLTISPILRNAGAARHPRLGAADDRRFV